MFDIQKDPYEKWCTK